MEQRFGLIFGRLEIYTEKIWAVKYATFDGVFLLCFQEYLRLQK